MRKITLGTDTEGFLYHVKSQQHVPATSFNTPETSEKRGSLGVYGTFHRDNILIEYQTFPAPISKFPSMVRNARVTLSNILWRRGFRAFYSPIIEYKDPRMVACPEALEMGCNPDLCAYTGEKFHGPTTWTDLGLSRVAGGHIHIGGIEDYSEEQKRNLVKLLDIFFAQKEQSTLVSWNTELRRREFYGQWGRWRDKPYGLEYRSPGPWWPAGSLSQTAQIGTGVQICVNANDAQLNADDFRDQAELPTIHNLVTHNLHWGSKWAEVRKACIAKTTT